jgi:hypothetical protein
MTLRQTAGPALAGALATVAFGAIGGPNYAAIAALVSISYLICSGRPEAVEGGRAWVAGAHAACAAAPLGTVILLYLPITQAWWLADDPAILRHIIEYPLAENSNLTPLLPLSLGLDYAIFGLEPRGFYAHQLISLCGLAVVGYAVLTRYLAPCSAAAAMTILLTSLPAATLAQHLMTRHYIEGLVLALLASLLYLVALSRNAPWISVPGAVLYALAAAAKEIYVPLVLLLPFLAPEQRWRTRLRYLAPFAAIAGAYSGWRLYMLRPANAMSGYGSAYDAANQDFRSFLSDAASALGWGTAPALAFIGILCLLGILGMLLHHRRYLGALLVAVLIVGLPLVPVAPIIGPRLLILVAGLITLIGVAGAAWLAQQRAGRTLHLCLIFSLAWIGLNLTSLERSAVGGERAWIERYRVEGEWVLHGGAEKTLLQPIGPLWFYDGLAWIREHKLLRGDAPLVCFDACLCDRELLNEALAYQQGGLAPAPPPDNCPPTKHGQITVSAAYDPNPGIFRWFLDSGQPGQWYFLLEPGAAQFPVTHQGSIPMYRADTQCIRVMHESPSGSREVSPLVCIKPTGVAEDCDCLPARR